VILTADMRKPVGGFVWCDPFCFWRPLIDLAEKQKTRTRRVFRGATSGNRVPEAIT